MIPQTALAFLAFMLLVVPGITFELLRQTRRPSFEQTTLEELARVVLASVAFSGIAILILAGFGALVGEAVLNLGLLAANGLGWYWHTFPEVLVASVFLEVAIATSLAFLVHRSLNHPQRRGMVGRIARMTGSWLRHDATEQVARFPVWRTLFRDLRPHGASTKITLVKKDGTLIMGLLGAYTASGSEGYRDIALTQPIEIFRPGYGSPRKLPDGWKLVLVSADEISEIFVTWPPKAVEDWG